MPLAKPASNARQRKKAFARRLVRDAPVTAGKVGHNLGTICRGRRVLWLDVVIQDG